MQQELAALGFERTWLPFSAILVRLAAALFCGALIGFERERGQRAAGLRTHILICLSAALVALLTIEIRHHPAFASADMRLDPGRAIEAVTSGVAFLAAGLIVFSRGRVKNLTTGAGMWLSGTIGLSCGLGYAAIALAATGLAIFVLWALNLLERRLFAPRPDA